MWSNTFDISRGLGENSALGLPLEGVVVLAVEQYGAGPWATLQLADLGARVIKVEDPAEGGDVGRYVPPYAEGEDSLFFEAFNRGKESICLDIGQEEGRAVFNDLVRSADAVFCNLRGDLPERLGLTYAQLKDVNPMIVCCSLSGYGRSGPDAAVGAYDYVIQARAGWMSLTGDPQDPPVRSGLSLVDFSAGYVAAIALLSGMFSARTTGRGCDCDVSLFETALSLLNYVGTWVASRDYQPTRHPDSAHPSIVPFQRFGTQTDSIVIACPKEKFWQRLCTAFDLGELECDARSRGFVGRHANRDWVTSELQRKFDDLEADAIVEALREAGVPCAKVGDVTSALSDPQARARGAVAEYEHPRLGLVRGPASPMRVGDGPRPASPAPALGADTGRVLEELGGYDLSRIVALHGAGLLTRD